VSEDLSGPVVGRRRLSATLRRARSENGHTQEHVAAEMDWSLSKLIRIEKGSVGISTSDLKSLLHFYGVHDSDEVNGLVRLAKLSKERPWWAPFREQLPSQDFEKKLGLEAEATLIEIFQPSLIPGLLQTEAYVRHVLRAITSELTSEEIVLVREDVRLRHQQAILESPDPPEIRILLDEGSLRRVPGSTAALRHQLLHVADLGNRPNLNVEVIPYSAGPYMVSSSFTILSFAGSGDPSVVYLENAWYDELVERADQVERFQRLLELLRQMALSPEDSEKLIRTIADEVR
jgi:transcriptional regulator with XRE-family HTH domain